MTDGQRLDGSGPPMVSPPRLPWVRTLLFSLTLASLAIGSEEGFWRSQGYLPSVQDTPQLWQLHRKRVYAKNDKAVVFLGASRMHAAISLPILQERLPTYQIIQLAIYGRGSPVGALAQFACDSRFCGIIVCDIVEPFLRHSEWKDQQLYFAQRVHFVAAIESAIRSRMEDSLALFSPEVRPRASIARWMSGDNSQMPGFLRLRSSRELRLDFSRIADLPTYRKLKNGNFQLQYAVAEMPAPDRLMKDIAEIEGMVARIQSRGGHVVFVRMPSSGERYELEEWYHPRAKYWDRFASATSAECIHFGDIDALKKFECPDDSHLDFRDAPRFTLALAAELERRGVFDKSNSPPATASGDAL